MHKCKYCDFSDVKNNFQACDDCIEEIKEFKISGDILELINCGREPVVCTICIEEINFTKTVLRCKCCINMFHEECINAWSKINRKCPICRKNI